VDGEKYLPFFRVVNVVAGDIDTALEYARGFFRMEVRQTLRIEEVSEFDATEAEFEGVYSIYGYAFHREGE